MKCFFWPLFVILLMIGCVKKTLVQAKKIATEQEVKTTEMPSKYDGLSKLFYEVRYDDERLYLHLMTSEFFTKMKILRYGFNVYYDQTNKKSKAKGFQFPIENNLKLSPLETSALNNSYESPMQEKIIKRLVEYQLIQRNRVLHLNEDQSQPDIIASLLLDKKQLHYYASIPLSAIEMDPAHKDGRFTFGFISGGIELSLQEEEELDGTANDQEWREYDHNKPFGFWISVVQ